MRESNWSSTLGRVGRWADEKDRNSLPPMERDGPSQHVGTHRDRCLLHGGPGVSTAMWAMTKATFGVLSSPMTVPMMFAAALRSAQLASTRIERFPDQLHALAEGRTPPLPGDRTIRLPSAERYLITSDLHRCIPGRLDWPRRQRVKDLYARVLERYASEGWHLIENGDVEDFWMVGGSTWGVVYDVASLAEMASTPLPQALQPTRAAMCEHLDRIVANNAETYEVLRDGFAASDRYHRTMGNHDDAYTDPAVAGRLATHLPGTRVADTILLTPPGSTAGDGIGGVDAVVAHGHLTDSWNGPGFAALGRAITWIATGIDDLPRRTPRNGSARREGLPDEQATSRLLGGRGRNRLITIDPRYGGNRRFDSLDEQRLFARLAATAPAGGWPWLIHGHTHYPMLRPLDHAGQPTRYANSGCGILDSAFSALEWDGSRPEDPVRLVVWTDRDGDGPHRVELEPDGPTLRAA